MAEPAADVAGFTARRRADTVEFDGPAGAAGLRRDGDAWLVEDGHGALAGARLVADDDGGRVWILCAGQAGSASPVELGRLFRDEALGPEADLYYFLLGDGRAFRLVPRGGRDGGYALLGWETPGAFLEARAETEGWRVVANPAARGLTDLDTVAVLFAAAILDAEHSLARPRTA